MTEDETKEDGVKEDKKEDETKEDGVKEAKKEDETKEDGVKEDKKEEDKKEEDKKEENKKEKDKKKKDKKEEDKKEENKKEKDKKKKDKKEEDKKEEDKKEEDKKEEDKKEEDGKEDGKEEDKKEDKKEEDKKKIRKKKEDEKEKTNELIRKVRIKFAMLRKGENLDGNKMSKDIDGINKIIEENVKDNEDCELIEQLKGLQVELGQIKKTIPKRNIVRGMDNNKFMNNNIKGILQNNYQEEINIAIRWKNKWRAISTCCGVLSEILIVIGSTMTLIDIGDSSTTQLISKIGSCLNFAGVGLRGFTHFANKKEKIAIDYIYKVSKSAEFTGTLMEVDEEEDDDNVDNKSEQVKTKDDSK